MTKSQSGGEGVGCEGHGSCRCQGEKLKSWAAGGGGSRSASWLSGVVREAWGEKALQRVPLWATQELRSSGKLRTEWAAEVHKQRPGKKQWVHTHLAYGRVNLHSLNMRR